jgi:hypothetical protein
MKLRLFLTLPPLALCAAAALLPADEKSPTEKQASKADDYSMIAQAGPGVYKIDFDKQGRIQSCIVVGSSRISTALGAAKGKEVARQRAELRAKAELVKWLKEKVSVHQKSEDETIIFLEGNEENDKDALRESGKSVEKTTAKFETTAEGLARGLQVVHVEINGKEKEYSLVLKWKAKTAEAVKDVERNMNTPAEEKKPAGKENPQKTTKENPQKTTADTKKKPADKKTIPDKKINIDD